MRQHGAPREGLFLFNPNGHNWLWKRFIDPNRSSKWKQLYKCVEATPFDNPNLPADYLEQFEGLPDHWYQRFVMGSHEVFVGQIFVDYNPDVHVIEPFHIPQDWERWCCIDPGIGHEGAVSWVARDYDNNCYYYREVVKAGEPVDWWVDQIEYHEEVSDWGGPQEDVTARLIGPESRQRSQTDGRSVYDVYLEEGIDGLELADRDPIARINRVTSRLRPGDGHLHPLGLLDGDAPSLYFFNTLDYTLEHFPQYRWKPQRTNFSEESPAERPRKKDDHTVDNLGHILMAIGDSSPDVPENSSPLLAEQRIMDEHFERELAAAASRGPHLYRGGIE